MIHIPPALKHRRFALLWAGLLISVIGTQMQQWALFWHISQLSRDPIAVSALGGVRFLAVVAFSLVAGLVADRYNRRTILFVTQSTAMIVASFASAIAPSCCKLTNSGRAWNRSTMSCWK